MVYNNLWKRTATAILILIFLVPMVTVAQENKVTICHYPPGNTDNPQTITIDESALQAHLGHGDTLGPCTTNQEIPEFPSIAIPVAGALGMMFLISKKKEKK